MKKKLMFILLAAILVLSACGEKAQPSDKEHDMAHGEQKHVPNGDLQEVTASAAILPSFLDDKSEDMRLVYQMAGTATDIIEWMPCYCGCGESAGHGSNLNCFIDEVREDGSVVWDDHGTRCQVCLDIAVQSVMMTQDGKSLKEIREFIDENYKEGYAEPTDTPMPA
ncbi:PCYCGC domain-containing protein [Sporosarcina sp. E16_3]|uniref:PCYCGC motif-containing (lipo)protein n=1 Tax=Sporosarcina sp. E16_3 TaxID=2789293 RepID=UPI001A930003|nr:PCYCGC motif-containing (lipo)protein [Sporosarcina sp. E16_3]MBO0602071.1 PCYCGC domain-containing protein [Sporosarcina sp. E16_3]